MSRLVFVTTELQPETPGGAGVAVQALSSRLAADREVVILLLTPEPVEVAERPGITVIQSRIPEEGFVERSTAAAAAVAEVVEPGDRVEFQDFEGVAFHSLASRSTYGLDRVFATVRFHGTYDMIREAMDTIPYGMDVPAAMEREVMRMADMVLVASPGQRQTVIERYELEPDRVTISPLPVPEIITGGRKPAAPPVFTVIGRLDERKGPQDVVRAAVRLLEKGVELRVRFIGLDGWSPSNGTGMREWLEEIIGEHSDAFEFTGPVPRQQLHEKVADSTAIVVPSRFETFCYVAYEARLLGQPVIVADLDVFQGLFSPDTGALVYDRTVLGLADAMRELILRPELAEQLAIRPVPDPGEPWEAYRTEREPRHPRSQSGLGTAAVQRLEAAMTLPPELPKRGVLERMYRRVPPSFVAVAYKVIPRPIQRRLARRFSWSEEFKRRRYEEMIAAEPRPEGPPQRADQEERVEEFNRRAEAIAERIAAGAFPKVKNPDVTVVIPVYNDVSYLEETLLSVYEQTHDSWEIIVVDDGSTTPEAKAFFSGFKRPRARLLRQKNRGLSGARNAGISKARGRYIVPLDADDQLLPTFIETMLDALEKRPDAGYAHCYAMLHHDVDAYWITRPFNPYWQLLGNGVFGCALIRRDALEAVGGYDATMRSGNEDWELWLRFMEAGWDQVQVHEVLVKYRKHGVSMSVMTEARFEEGRRAVRDRHQRMYRDLARYKQQWYPMITVIGDDSSWSNVEIEVVAGPDDLRTRWGKYVVDTREATPIPEETLMRLADALEMRTDIAEARTAGEPPVVMRRRWNLHDRSAAPSGTITIDLPDQGAPNPLPDYIERAGWSVPPTDPDDWRPVQRQPPEEEGHLPDVWSW